MYAKMAIQVQYVVTKGTGDNAAIAAMTAIMSEAMNHPVDGA